MTRDIQIYDIPLDLTRCVNTVSDAGSGGIQVFIGNVRNMTGGKSVVRLEYEAYNSMALREMEKIANDIVKMTGCHRPMPFKSEWISDSL